MTRTVGRRIRKVRSAWALEACGEGESSEEVIEEARGGGKRVGGARRLR